MLAAHDAVMDTFNSILQFAAREVTDPEQRKAWCVTNEELRGCARAARRVQVVGPDRMAVLADALRGSIKELADTQRRALPHDRRLIAWAEANEVCREAERDFGRAAGEIITSPGDA